MTQRRILITGASGLLGHALCSYFSRGSEVIGFCHSHPVGLSGVQEVYLDLTDRAKVEKAMRSFRPDIVIHTAGLTNVDQCEADPDLARHLNVLVTEQLSEFVNELRAKLIHISTDHLFDGKRPWMTEDCPVNPINSYARTKAEAEQVALKSKHTLVIRTNFYGKGRPWRSSFSDWLFGSLSTGKTMNLFSDVFHSPIAISHLSELIGALIEKDGVGVFNVAGAERLSKYELGIRIAKKFNLDTALIRDISIDSAQLRAPRPKDMSLSIKKVTEFLGYSPPGVDSGIATLFFGAKP